MPKAWNIGFRSPVYLKIDEDCVLQCEARGWPKPRIIWMKDNETISDKDQDHKYQEIQLHPSQVDTALIHTASQLTIFDVQMKDSGRYFCVATNPVGVFKYRIRVQVEGDN